VGDLVVGEEEEEGEPGNDLDAGRLWALLAGLPALTSLKWLILRADLHRTPTAAAVRAFLTGAAHVIRHCCSRLQTLRLHITLLDRLAGQLPEALLRELASVRSLKDVALSLEALSPDDPTNWPAVPSLAGLVAGLAGLPRLRTLYLAVNGVAMEAMLPAGVSRLAQLTSLTLGGFHGLRVEAGWARLPTLKCLWLADCEFAHDGEAALPGIAALGALTSVNVWNCRGLYVLPAALWQLTQLQRLDHCNHELEQAGLQLSALPAAGPPASGAPCSASLTRLLFVWHNLPDFPPGILALRRLQHLWAIDCRFDRLPAGVSALTALTELRLGRHSAHGMEVGGSFDARALGDLARFPNLRTLTFENCRVLFCSDFQAAAAHPRLEQLALETSYPAPGSSGWAVVGFVKSLLQRGRPGVFELRCSVVEGAGRRDSRDFRAALRFVGYSLSEADAVDLVQAAGRRAPGFFWALG